MFEGGLTRPRCRPGYTRRPATPGSEPGQVPTHLPPEIQNTLTGFWCYGQNGLTPEILAHLVDDVLPSETVRDWTELVRYLPPGMLRPSDPPASHWHARLAEYCEKHQRSCRYALQWVVQHHLSAEQTAAAVGWLTDFDYLYRRLQLGSTQARQLWQELQQIPATLRPGEWEAFWRGRQFLVNPAQESNPEPHLTFLALADAYSAGSSLSQQAADWLQRVGPETHWLRSRFRPSQPYSQPLLLELPEHKLQMGERDHESVARLLFSPDGKRLITVSSHGQAHAWEVNSGRDLGHLELPEACYHWSEDGLLALSQSRLYVLEPDTFAVLETQELPGDEPWGREMSVAAGRLATSNSLCQVLVWDWRQRRSLAVLPPPERGLHALSLSRDGRRVTVLSESDAHGCDLDESGQPLRYHRNLLRPWSEEWAPGQVQVRGRQLELADGRARLAENLDEIWEWCCEGDWALLWEHGSWRLWNLEKARPMGEFGWPTPDQKVTRDARERYVVSQTREVLGRSECVLLDQDRTRALTWKLGASAAHILDVEAGLLVATLAGQRDALVNASLSADGRRAATVTRAGNLRIWDTRNGKCLRLLKGRAVAAALSPDGSLALSGDAEGQVRLWNLSRGHCLVILEGHTQPIQWLAFAHDGIMISGDCECFRVWNAERQCLTRIGRPPRLYAREVSPCGRFLYAEQLGDDGQGSPLVYDLDRGQVQAHMDCASSKPSAATFSADSRQLAVANQEGEFHESCSLRVWEQDRVLESYRLPMAYNALALNKTHLAASCKGNLVRIWERAGAAPPGHDAAVLCLDQRANRLISGAIDKAACIWSLDTGDRLHRLEPGEGWVQGVRLCGPYAFTASENEGKLWDLERGLQRVCDQLPVAANRQGDVLGFEGKQLWLWNPRKPAPKPVRIGTHPPAIRCCAFSPDGTRAISANQQGGLKLWDLSRPRCLKSWQTPAAEIHRIDWVESEVVWLRSADGRGWAWDLGHGTGSRVEAESESAGQLRLETGNRWRGKPLKVWSRQQRLATWWFPIQHALEHDSNRVVATQDTGEIHFLELLPPGPTRDRPAVQASARPQLVRPRLSGLQRTPLDKLNPCRRILLVASGGRSDLLAALPLATTLTEMGKEIFLAAPLSGRKPSERYREIPPKGKAFENRLVGLMQLPLYAFAPEGTLPRLEVYRDLVRNLSIDGLVLVEAGVETLLRGDEPSLGTAADDLVSLAAASQLELPVKMLANLGLGFDLGKGMCHAYTLDRMAELTRVGGFWGSFSLLPGRPEFALLLEAAQMLAPSHPAHLLLQGLAGEFGGEAYLNPLMNQYWCFDLDQVASGCQMLEWLQDKITAMDVHRALTNYLTVQTARPWTEISC